MSSLVANKIGFPTKSFFTLQTLKWFLTHVSSSVPYEVCTSAEAFITLTTQDKVSRLYGFAGGQADQSSDQNSCHRYHMYRIFYLHAFSGVLKGLSGAKSSSSHICYIYKVSHNSGSSDVKLDLSFG